MADMFHALLFAIVKHPEILLGQIVASDAPVHEPLIDVAVRCDDHGRTVRRCELLDLFQRGSRDIIQPSNLA